MENTLLNEQESSFVLENARADVNALRLKRCSARLVNAIEARSRIERKLPLWFAHPELLYASMLSVQQCSSQATACYKRLILQGVFSSGNHALRAADLTGGMGVDSLFLSSLCRSFLYVERNTELYESVRENFKVLVPSLNNGTVPSIEFRNCEISPENLGTVLGEGHYDFIFADPARRSASDSSKKLVALSEYTPDILTMKESLLERCSYLLVKVSPMADISQLLRELPETIQIHVVSVDNDCKELLLLLKGNNTDVKADMHEVEVSAVNIKSDKVLENLQIFRYSLGEKCTAGLADPGKLLEGGYQFLFEPGKSILKCGAAALQASQYGLLQLAPSSNLFVSNVALNQADDNNHRCGKEEYQGRQYRILEVIPFSRKTLKEVFRKYQDAGVTARNFPMSTNAVVAAARTRESAQEHLFFTTLSNGGKVIIAAGK